MLRGVLLDIDGTLIDSNDAHAESWRAVLRDEGFAVEFAEVRAKIGEGGDKLLPQLTGVPADSDRGRELARRRSALFHKEYLPAIRPFPRARELLERLRALGLKLVVATSADPAELGEFLDLIGCRWLIDEASSSADAEASKPDPDIIQAALAKGGLRPREAVMLGDTPYDIQAAARAGVRTIALRSGGWSDAELAGAVEIQDDVGALLAALEESPVFGPVCAAATDRDTQVA